MDHQQSPTDHIHHHEQSHQPRESSRPPGRNVPQGQPPGHPVEQRREFLWRERISLKMQVRSLTAHAAALEKEWDALQQRKASMHQQKPKLAVLIVLSRLVGIRSLPAERRFWYERERLVQEEARLQQARSWCEHDLAALQTQIEVIQQELASLTALAALASSL